MKYKEIEGDLIAMALEGNFNAIAHGCNCFCTMGAGIAPQMAKAFNVDKYIFESYMLEGDIDKLGRIEWVRFYLDNDNLLFPINAYTQYASNGPLDYEALIMCLRKINKNFKGKHIGLPQIGCGLAGGSWTLVKQIIQNELKDCDVTVVIYNK